MKTKLGILILLLPSLGWGQSTQSTFGGYSGGGCGSSATCTVTVTNNTTVQAIFNGTSLFSPTNQQPVTSEFYPATVWTKTLPADVMSHLATNSDAIVSHIFNGADQVDNGVLSQQVIDPSLVTVSQGEYYYASCSDPVFRINAGSIPHIPSGPNATSDNDPNGKYFHMPSGAKFDAIADDMSLTILDQCGDLDPSHRVRMFRSYHFQSTSGIRQLPTTCTATSAAQADAQTACQLTSATVDNFGEVNYPYTDTVAWGNGATRSDGGPAGSEMLREQELMQGVVQHAIGLDGQCVASNNANEFPGVNFGPLLCSPSDTLRPVAGSHFFIDKIGRDAHGYDCDAQVSGVFVLPAWQRPVCHALQDYGGYFHDTFGPSSGIVSGLNVNPIENGINFTQLGLTDPYFTSWLTNLANQACSGCTQTAGTSGWTFFNGPTIGGNAGFRIVQSGSSASKVGLYFLQMPGLITGTGAAAHNDGHIHLHIANECIAIGLAGLTSYNSVSACN